MVLTLHSFVIEFDFIKIISLTSDSAMCTVYIPRMVSGSELNLVELSE